MSANEVASVARPARVLCQDPSLGAIPEPSGRWPDGKSYAIVCTTWPKPTRSFVICTGWEHKDGFETFCSCTCHQVRTPSWEELLRSPQWKPFGSEEVERSIAGAKQAEGRLPQDGGPS